MAYLGKYYFETAIILRNSFLVGSILCSSETWYNVTEKEIRTVEQIDESFLRKLMETGKGCPLAMLYLTLGIQPLRFVVKSRRLNFLHYMLNENEDSMLNKFLICQINQPSRGDWIHQTLKDLKEFEINISLDELKNIPKNKFKQIVREKGEEKNHFCIY